MAIQLNLSDRDERTLKRIVEELGYKDPTDLVEHFIAQYREKRVIERLSSIGSRMFPGGPVWGTSPVTYSAPPGDGPRRRTRSVARKDKS